ncbi:hypothetical protein SH2C18_49670 [Clostridium sediminicola]|uniref:Flp pilus assembly protein CpaB n=1 Tax=Clostridium sediminicola TaxID=3114879 RepID=UPI0031F24BFF
MKSRNILILALIMALITTILFNQYLKSLDDKYKKNENKISVVVPSTKINKNQKITAEMLQLKELDSESVHPQAIKNIEEIQGRYALSDMKEGEILFLDRFVDQYEEVEFVTRKIRDGYRAVSIEVNFVESVSNLIDPENFVDIIFSEPIMQDGKLVRIDTEIILEDIRVLAVGKRLKEKDTKISDLSETNGANEVANNVEYVSVTLELQPNDIVKLVNCDKRGDINLILRSEIFP